MGHQHHPMTTNSGYKIPKEQQNIRLQLTYKLLLKIGRIFSKDYITWMRKKTALNGTNKFP